MRLLASYPSVTGHVTIIVVVKMSIIVISKEYLDVITRIGKVYGHWHL